MHISQGKHKGKRDKKVMWRLTILSFMINVFKKQKLKNRCSIAFHGSQLSFFLGFLLCSISCWYSIILKRKRSCMINMKWEALRRANIVRTMSICIRKLLVTFDNDRKLEWMKKTSNCLLSTKGEKSWKLKSTY